MVKSVQPPEGGAAWDTTIRLSNGGGSWEDGS